MKGKGVGGAKILTDGQPNSWELITNYDPAMNYKPNISQGF